MTRKTRNKSNHYTDAVVAPSGLEPPDRRCSATSIPLSRALGLRVPQEKENQWIVPSCLAIATRYKLGYLR